MSKNLMLRVTCSKHGESLVKVQCPACEHDAATVFTPSTVHKVTLEPEWSGLWKSFDALMGKVFRWPR